MEPGSQIQEGRYNGPPVPKGRHICSRGIYPTVRGNAKNPSPEGTAHLLSCNALPRSLP